MKSKTESGAQEKILCLATRNRHKVEEMASLREKGWQIKTIADYPTLPEIEETGKTFLQNATLKAITISRLIDDFVLADDSGLEVDALNGKPGVYSARYAGMPSNDQKNNEKLLHELKNASRAADRKARFRCLLVLARQDQMIASFEGVCEGSIAESPRGKNGFGYDPLFQPEGYEQTFGELAPQIKLRISHRAKALEIFLKNFKFAA